MKSIDLRLAIAAVLALGNLLGCQSKDSGPTESTRSAAPDSAYAKDIAALCDSVTRSGADQGPADAKALTIANWLAANLTTPESRKFLVRIQPLVGEEKASALETEAKRVGLTGCALAEEWRAATPPTPPATPPDERQPPDESQPPPG